MSWGFSLQLFGPILLSCWEKSHEANLLDHVKIKAFKDLAGFIMRNSCEFILTELNFKPQFNLIFILSSLQLIGLIFSS